jgi:hypothetical protein
MFVCHALSLSLTQPPALAQQTSQLPTPPAAAPPAGSGDGGAGGGGGSEPLEAGAPPPALAGAPAPVVNGGGAPTPQHNGTLRPFHVLVPIPHPRGGLAVIPASPTSTVLEILDAVRLQFELPAHGGYFLWRGKPLRSQLTLSAYNVPNGATLDFFFPLPGGAPAAQLVQLEEVKDGDEDSDDSSSNHADVLLNESDDEDMPACGAGLGNTFPISLMCDGVSAAPPAAGAGAGAATGPWSRSHPFPSAVDGFAYLNHRTYCIVIALSTKC